MRNSREVSRYRFTLAFLVGVVLLAGCATGQTQPPPAAPHTSSPSPIATTTTAATATPPSNGSVCVSAACAAQGVQVFVEPDAGEAPILNAIKGAAQSVWVEVYLLTDANVMHALEDASQRGVDVRVLLEAHPYGEGSVSPQQTIETLNAAGVHAQAADPAYYYTHAKVMLIDDATAYIMTCNLSRSGLGGSSAAANREYGVIDTDAGDVAEVNAIFQADWNRTPTPALTQSRLVVSPVNARTDVTALIASAKSTLHIEDEEMYDAASVQALIAAAQRGVNVEVTLPSSAASSSDEASAVAQLTQGGVHVRYLQAPYMHAKLIVVDGTLAFTGSENFSSTSLDQNREIGVIIADTQALTTFESVFGQDWALAQVA